MRPLPPLPEPADWIIHSAITGERSAHYTAAQMQEYATACVAEEREACAKLCEAFMHNVPDEGGDDLDHIGRYSNGTVKRCAAAIRARA